MTEGDREFEKAFPNARAIEIFPMDGKATECPRCSLKFSTLLHPFCQHTYCPVRDWETRLPKPTVAPESGV